MYSIYDVTRSLQRYEHNSEFKYRLSADKKTIVNKETGAAICSVEEFAVKLRKDEHCDFEVVYCEHVSLSTILRCKECGTVIFSRDDEDYDPNLKCPTCGNYKTHFPYYTKEQIDFDEEKRKEIKFYENMQKTMEEMAERRAKRGLSDWEICKKNFMIGQSRYEFSLECANLFSKYRKGIMRLKGLNLYIQRWEKDENTTGYICKNRLRIPLSLYAVYLQWIIPLTRKYRLAKSDAENDTAQMEKQTGQE